MTLSCRFGWFAACFCAFLCLALRSVMNSLVLGAGTDTWKEAAENASMLTQYPIRTIRRLKHVKYSSFSDLPSGFCSRSSFLFIYSGIQLLLLQQFENT